MTRSIAAKGTQKNKHLHLIVEDSQHHLVQTADSEEERNVLVPEDQLEAIERTIHGPENTEKRKYRQDDAGREGLYWASSKDRTRHKVRGQSRNGKGWMANRSTRRTPGRLHLFSPLNVCQVFPRKVVAEKVNVASHKQRHNCRAKAPYSVEVPHVEIRVVHW